jgi:hypothetical protein
MMELILIYFAALLVLVVVGTIIGLPKAKRDMERQERLAMERIRRSHIREREMHARAFFGRD